MNMTAQEIIDAFTALNERITALEQRLVVLESLNIDVQAESALLAHQFSDELRTKLGLPLKP